MTTRWSHNEKSKVCGTNIDLITEGSGYAEWRPACCLWTYIKWFSFYSFDPWWRRKPKHWALVQHIWIKMKESVFALLHVSRRSRTNVTGLSCFFTGCYNLLNMDGNLMTQHLLLATRSNTVKAVVTAFRSWGLRPEGSDLTSTDVRQTWSLIFSLSMLG